MIANMTNNTEKAANFGHIATTIANPRKKDGIKMASSAAAKT